MLSQYTRSLAGSEAECTGAQNPAPSTSRREDVGQLPLYDTNDEFLTDDSYFDVDTGNTTTLTQTENEPSDLEKANDPFLTDEEKAFLKRAKSELGTLKFMELLLDSYVNAKVAEASYLEEAKRNATTEANALKAVEDKVDVEVFGDDFIELRASRRMHDHLTLNEELQEPMEIDEEEPLSFLEQYDRDLEEGRIVEDNLRRPVIELDRSGYPAEWYDWNPTFKRPAHLRPAPIYDFDDCEYYTESDDLGDVVPNPTVSGEENITFVDNRPKESDSTHTNKDISTTDDQNDMAELIWTARKVLTREILIYQNQWVSQDFKWQFPIPKCLTDKTSSAMVSQLKLFGFLRAGVRFRIQVNGTKFHCGRLIAYLVPPFWKDDADLYNKKNLVCFPHVFLDASQSNSAELFVPFVSILSHFPQRQGSLENDSICTLGRMMIEPFNILRAATGASSELPVTVYARFDNPEVHQITYPISTFSYGDGLVTQAKGSGLEGGLKQALSNVAGTVGRMTGGLVTGGLNTLLDFVLDKPTAPLPAEPMVNKSINAPCHGAGIDHSTRLALTPISQTETTVGQMGATNPDFDLKTLTQIPSLAVTTRWKNGDTKGKVLYRQLVSPTYLDDEHFSRSGNAVMKITPTMLAYVSRAFVYWRGDLKMKIAVVATQFHSGRLAVIYDPTWSKGTQGLKDAEDLDSQMNHNMVVIDIEQASEVEVDLPYMSIRPWLRCDALRQNDSLDNAKPYGTNLGETACGIVRIFILQPLVNPSNVPGEIDVNIFIYAGNNFELAYPSSLFPLDVTREAASVYGADQEYPFILGYKTSPYFTNREYIIATYFDGRKLYLAGKLAKLGSWWNSDSTGKWGDDEQTLNWISKARQLKRYTDDDTNGPQAALMRSLPEWTTASDTLINIEKTVQKTESKLDNPVIPDLKGVAKGVETVLSDQVSMHDTIRAVNNRVYTIEQNFARKDELAKTLTEAQQANTKISKIQQDYAKQNDVEKTLKEARDASQNAGKAFNGISMMMPKVDNLEEEAAAIRVDISRTDDKVKSLTTEVTKAFAELTTDIKEVEKDLKLTNLNVLDVADTVAYNKGKIDKIDVDVYNIPKVGSKWRNTAQFNSWGEFTLTGPFAPAEPKEDEAIEFETQMEANTTRDNELATVVATTGNASSQVAPQTISENAMNLQTVLRRAYPWYNSGPIYGITGYTLMTIPVNPTFTPTFKESIVNAFATPSPVTNLAWFSRLFTYWRGSLRYKFLFDAPVDAFCWHIPQDCNKHNIMTGVNENDIQTHMAYAGTLAATRLQASLEVEVPFASPYNQCLIDVHRKVYDLRAQNGTLYLAFRTDPTKAIAPVTVSAFIAAGEDYVLNVLKAPPDVFQPQYMFSACKETSTPHIQISCTDTQYNLGNNSDKTILPGGTGMKHIDSQGHMWKCTPEEGPIPEMETQALEDWFVSPQTKDNYTTLIKSLTEATQTLHSISLQTTGIPDDIRQTTQNLRELTDSLKTMVAPARVITNQYVDISVKVTLLVVTMNEFKGLMKEFSFQNVMRFAMAFAGFLGYNFSESLKILLNGIVNYIAAPQLPQTQAIDEAIADAIEENEEYLVPVVAVIGTIIYAYIFDCVPHISKVKKVIQEFFESESSKEEPLVTQSKLSEGMKSMHFSVLGCKAINTVFEKMCELIKRFLDWILERENPKVIAQRKAGEYQERILGLIKKIDDLECEQNFIQALSDSDVHNKFYLLMDEANNLMEVAVKQDLDAKVSLLIKESRERMRKLIVRLEKEHPITKFRYDPFVVCIHGETGTCKTEFMREVSNAIAEELGLSEYNRIYNRTVTKDGFWNNYKNQPIVEWDEFAQNKETEGVIGGFVELRGNAPLQVPMAALEDKGRYFTSQAIVMTTNVPYARFELEIRDPNAFLRRRHLMIGCQHRPGVDVHQLQRGEDFDPTFDMIEYAETSNMTHDVIRPGMSAADVLELVRERVRVWHRKQLAIKAHVEQDPMKIMPRGIIAITETDEEEEEDDELFQEAQEVHEYENLFVTEAEDEATTCHCPRVRFVKVDDMDLTEEEELERALFIDRMERANCCERTLYLRMKNKVRTTVSGLYQMALDYFKSAKETVVNWFKENPKVVTVAGVLGLLGTAGVLLLTQNKNEPEASSYGVSPHLVGRARVVTEVGYESNPHTVGRKTVVTEKGYDSNPKVHGRNVVVTEGCSDPQSLNIQRRLHNYLCQIRWVTANKKSSLKCLQVGGSVILTPFHFFANVNEGSMFEVTQRDIPVPVEFSKERMVRLDDKDWVLYNCGAALAPKKKNIDYFIKESELPKFKRAAAVLLMLTQDNTQLVKTGTVEAVRELKYKDPKAGDIYKQTGWATHFSTEPGDCGSVAVVESNLVAPPGKAIGIHVAGRPNASEGFVVLITYEMIKRAWDLIEIEDRQVIGMPVVESLNPDLTTCKIVPVGDYSLYGSLPNKLCPIQPAKTAFVKTPFHEEALKVTSPPKVPAHLRPFNKGEERISPLAKALGKYGKETKPFPLRNRKKVASFMKHWMKEALQDHQGKRIFSEEEAVNGIPGCDELQKLNMKSSAGWPYQILNRTAGKRHLFSEDGKVIDAELRKRLDERLNAAKGGERVPSLWRDCLKDELRPKEKAEAGKTRLFTIAPVDYTILVRRYFMDFIGSFYKSHLKFFSAVGINPESYEWTELYNKLAECGTDTIAGDFCTFDGTLMADLIELFCEIVNEWYDDGPEAEMVRKVLINEIIHTMQLVENTVYATHKGNPSGNPLTVILNTIVNVMYMLLAWLEIYPEATLDDFRRFVRIFAYGDDNLLTVKDHPLFNQNSISKVLAKYGIEYTAETKDSGPVEDYRSLSKVTFLKRGFRKDPTYGNSFWLPTMSVDTLQSFWFYVRMSSDEVGQLQENMRCGLMFAAFHGKEFYDNYLKTWQQLMKSKNLQSLQISHEEQVDVFRYTCGMLVGRPEEYEGFMKVSNSKVGRAINGILASPLYYLASATGIMATDRTVDVEDDRWAVAIPSGEGKSTLCRKFPDVFVDHDDLLMPEFSIKGLLTKGKYPWKSEYAVTKDFPKEDRRILLVHHPNNTKRRLIGSFVTHYPTYIRINAMQRLLLKNPIKMTRDERNAFLVQFAAEHEPQLFGLSSPLPSSAGEVLTSDLNQLEVGQNATAWLGRPAEENATADLNQLAEDKGSLFVDSFGCQSLDPGCIGPLHTQAPPKTRKMNCVV